MSFSNTIFASTIKRVGGNLFKVISMPLVMLRRDWPANFRRTVMVGKKTVQYEFVPGIPVELDGRTIEAMKRDIGKALLPCEMDDRGFARIITDDVISAVEEGVDDGKKPE